MSRSPPAANGGVPSPAGLALREGRIIAAAPDAATLCTPLRADGDLAIHALDGVGPALALLREQSADVLVLDWDDPAFGAAAACAAVRADPRLAATWIVAVVGRWGHAAAARSEGADDVIVRPLQAPEIAARIGLGVAAARERAGDHLLRTLLAHVPGVLYRSAWDRGYTVELISDEIERITGFPAADFIERRRTLLSIMHPADVESVMARAAEATDGRSFVLEYRLVTADGAVRWMIDRGQLVYGRAGRVWMDGVIVDVTDLREAEHALRREAVEHVRVEELRASRARIVAAADAARRRIERDLHDGAQQRLVTVRLQLALARRRMEADPETAGALVDAVGEELRLALAELRELARGIHPATLSERGLRSAVEALAARCPLPVEVEDIPADRFRPSVEAAAYFTISEALTNVAKYASAGYATVRGKVEHDALVVEVRDDGIGGADAADGSGLTGLADRVRAQGGTLSVRSPAGAGTTVRAVIPLDGCA